MYVRHSPQTCACKTVIPDPGCSIYGPHSVQLYRLWPIYAWDDCIRTYRNMFCMRKFMESVAHILWGSAGHHCPMEAIGPIGHWWKLQQLPEHASLSSFLASFLT